MSNNADLEETGLFGTVARLQEGGSVSGKQLADGFREAGKLTVSMKNLEDQVGNLLTRIRNVSFPSAHHPSQKEPTAKSQT